MPINNAVYDEQSHTWWQPNSSLSLLQALNPGRFAYLDTVLNAQKQCYEGLKILDVGCGGGFICEEFASRGAQVTGVDPSRPSLEVAAQHAGHMDYDIDYQHGSGEKLPFADNSFDLVSCCDVLEHVEDLAQTINEISRVLKPGGIFFYDTINRTTLSWLIMIKLIQDFSPTRLVPRNTHVWRMFIKPHELKAHLKSYHLANQDLVGLGPKLTLRSALALGKARTGRIDSSTLGRQSGMGPTKSKQLTYMGWAIKR